MPTMYTLSSVMAYADSQLDNRQDRAHTFHISPRSINLKSQKDAK